MMGPLSPCAALRNAVRAWIVGADPAPDMGAYAERLGRHVPDPRSLPAIGWRTPVPVTCQRRFRRAKDLSANAERVDEILRGGFGARASLAGLLTVMAEETNGVGVSVLQITEGFGGYLGIELLFSNPSGYSAKLTNHFFPDKQRPGYRIRAGGGLGSSIQAQGLGIGRSLFLNFARWCREAGRVSQFRFVAEGRGLLAWSHRGGVRVFPKTIEDLRNNLHYFNNLYHLSIPAGSIDQLQALQQVSEFRIEGEPPGTLVSEAREYYRRVGMKFSEGDLREKAKGIGDLAILRLGYYEGRIDLMPGSPDAEAFFKSV